MARRGRRRARRSKWKRRLRIVAALVVTVVAAYVVGTAIAGPFFWYPCSLNGLEAHGEGHASILYASDGTRLGVLGASRDRIPVSFGQISPVMRQAIVAIEDRRFYRHGGIDYLGIVRALTADVRTGSIAQGGSTIEQQLVRNLYLSPQQTIGRKLTEGCLAVQLSREWSKQRILAAYLDDVYFGQQAYGIEAAARTYFGIHARQLDLAQAALLAGLPQAPSTYDPLVDPRAARTRRAEVLRAMLRSRDISPAEYRRALASPLGLRPGKAQPPPSESYLTDFITSQLVDQYGAERVRRGGLAVYTTLDARLQAQATHAVLDTLDRNGDPAGAVVSIDPATGRIRAMAAAETGSQISFDIPADGQRQAGSTFKAFVLADAVRRGINPWSTLYLSAPFAGPDGWHVQTFEHTYSGRIPLSRATLLSDNTVYARLTLDLGPRSVAVLAHRMGVRSTLEPDPSIGLGSNAISPLDLASAYATFADGGVARQPTILTKVGFPDGHTEQAADGSATRVLDEKVAAAVTRVLEANVQAGTGTAAALAGRPAAGKTGTTTNFADAWFAGYVPQLTTVVWVGYPSGEKPMLDVHGIPGVTGGSLPAEIWHAYMTAALAAQPVEQFADPGAPPYRPWCGRYEFALTWLAAQRSDRCAAATVTGTTTPGTTQQPVTTLPQVTTTTETIATTTQPATTAPPPTTQPATTSVGTTTDDTTTTTTTTTMP
jgi:penicillin-binding protein 1A